MSISSLSCPTPLSFDAPRKFALEWNLATNEIVASPILIRATVVLEALAATAFGVAYVAEAQNCERSVYVFKADFGSGIDIG